MQKTLRIATRQSPLALWQAKYVKSQLERIYPQLNIELLKMLTKGDKILDVPLAKVGGKGLFIKELEQGMLAGEADIAVHSMKDVPMDLPPGFTLAAICPRENPLDAFVANSYDMLANLPRGAIVGTSSLRRKSQLLHLRPDLEVRDLRGNVNTRLQKLDDGMYDAIILAAAGLLRLGKQDRISSQIASEIILPAVGQGAVGIECVSGSEAQKIVAPLNCVDTSYRVRAERALNRQLEGGCQAPIAGFATLAQGKLSMRALVSSIDGTELVRVAGVETAANFEKLGIGLANELLNLGADKILSEIYS